jgi:hypothetical protein
MRQTSLIVLLVVGCAHGQAPAPRLDSTLRFHNAGAVTALAEGPAVPRPATRPFDRSAYFFDAYVGQRTVRALSPAPAGRARDVNALDEVPDGSWFENRIGARPLTPEDLRRGPTPVPPFRVMGGKAGGTSTGIRIKDATGVGYLLKFDRPEDPDSETAADIVVQRLLWAIGYHTSEDALVFFRAEDLIVDPKAKVKDSYRGDRPMTAADLRAVLARVGRRADGSYRGLASKLLTGVPVGGYAQEGVRADDPSDVIPHEDRRELRGGRVFFAWLNHVDMKEDNVLDMWVEDPRTPGRGRVRHHLVDFGNSLGIFNWQTETSAGFTQLYDFSHGARSFVSFGLWQRPWERVSPSGLRGVGIFESTRFDPSSWRSRYPWAPFERFDRFDGFWAARILQRITPAHVAAVVAEAHYEDPRSSVYMTRTLIERQRKLVRHYLSQVSPLDGFRVEGGRLCFQDLLAESFAEERAVSHRLVAWDWAGRRLAFAAEVSGGQVCAPVPAAPDHDGYTIIDITTRRADAQRVLVHLARAPQTGQLRVIGIRRL